MAKEQFITKRFSLNSQTTISLANAILAEYARQGFDLSLRQLYYQFVARGLLENSQKSYKNLGSVIADARLAGLIDWNHIQDRGRELVTSAHWGSPADIVEAAAQQFRIDKWADQDYRIYVMVEKQALEGVLQPICRKLDVAFIANKGYSSASTMYSIGKLMEDDHRMPVVLYLGDHDPSGIDMTRDVEDRLVMFSHTNVEVRRLALNMPQVEQYNPPPNPAKEADARFKEYAKKFGETCWELDALNPTTLADLVEDAVYDYRDADKWQAAVEKEEYMRDALRGYAADYRRREKENDD